MEMPRQLTDLTIYAKFEIGKLLECHVGQLCVLRENSIDRKKISLESNKNKFIGLSDKQTYTNIELDKTITNVRVFRPNVILSNLPTLC